jgi:signal transduction histidine kinase
MGQLTASISHEVTQPITAGITYAQAALNWLRAQPPKLDDVHRALGRAVEEGNRATDILTRIGALFRKAPQRKDAVDINEAILGVVRLTHGEAAKNDVSVETRLADGLPLIQADPVQLQQVILNLIMNSLEAMSSLAEGSRELLISTGKDAAGDVLVTVQDSGPGLSSEACGHAFDAFYTTKAGGMGMGLSICRSIVEQHGGRIWPSRKAGPGAIILFTLPVEGTLHEAAVA